MQYLSIHPENPQARLVSQAVVIVRSGGVIVYPTDSTYALGCHIGDAGAIERIRRIRALPRDHNFTLVCRDLSELATYARVDNASYRLIKAFTPGPYTFILKATREVPRRLLHPKRKTIGLRVPDHRIVHAMLDALGEPLLSVTLSLPGEEVPVVNPETVRDRLKATVDAIIDGGATGYELTTVIDLVDGVPQIIRTGKGDVSALLRSNESRQGD